MVYSIKCVLLVSFFVSSYIFVFGGNLDVETEFKRYTKCNGKPVKTSQYIAPALAAFIKGGCVKYKNFDCSSACVFYNYPDMMKGDKTNWEYFEKEFKNMKTENPELRTEAAEIFTAAKLCDFAPLGGRTYYNPKNADDVCREATKVRVCLEEAYKKICNRKYHIRLEDADFDNSTAFLEE